MQGFVFPRPSSLLAGVFGRPMTPVGAAERRPGTDEAADPIARRAAIFDRAAAQARIGLWECDLATDALAWTDGVYDLFELPRKSVVSRADAVALYEPESRRRMEALRARSISERATFGLDARIRTALGNERWMRLTASVECVDGRPVRLFGIKQDITEERATLDRLRGLAESDHLTGLANRTVLQGRLESGAGALLLLDLDGFKRINDTHGHLSGDECLRIVAARLRQVCPENALVARLGGDEFAVVMAIGTTHRAVADCGDRVLAALSRPIRWNDHAFALSASIGIAMVGGAGEGRLMIEADLALYAAKNAGRNRSRIFAPDLEAARLSA